MNKVLVAAGIVVPTFVAGVTFGALAMKDALETHRGDLSTLMGNALKNVITKANEGILTEDELIELVDSEMEFIKMTMKNS